MTLQSNDQHKCTHKKPTVHTPARCSTSSFSRVFLFLMLHTKNMKQYYILFEIETFTCIYKVSFHHVTLYIIHDFFKIYIITEPACKLLQGVNIHRMYSM